MEKLRIIVIWPVFSNAISYIQLVRKFYAFYSLNLIHWSGHLYFSKKIIFCYLYKLWLNDPFHPLKYQSTISLLNPLKFHEKKNQLPLHEWFKVTSELSEVTSDAAEARYSINSFYHPTNCTIAISVQLSSINSHKTK